MRTPLIHTILALFLLPEIGHAGALEEEYVRSIGGGAIQIATRGSGNNEIRSMHSALAELVDWQAFAQAAFGESWHALSRQQQILAAQTFLARSAREFASDLDGNERLTIVGSEDIGAGSAIVNSTIALPRQPEMELRWIVATNNGRRRVTDIILEGRSSVAVYAMLIEEYSENGNVRIEKVLDRMLQ